MQVNNAFFTPGLETVHGLMSSKLYGVPASDQKEVSFSIMPVEGDDKFDLKKLEDVALYPINSICVNDGGYEVAGRRKGMAGIMGRLVVMTNVEPPIAHYTETIIEND